MAYILYTKKCQKHTSCAVDYPCPFTVTGENNTIILFVAVTITSI